MNSISADYDDEPTRPTDKCEKGFKLKEKVLHPYFCDLIRNIMAITMDII